MLRHLDEHTAADHVMRALGRVLIEGRVRTRDLGGTPRVRAASRLSQPHRAALRDHEPADIRRLPCILAMAHWRKSAARRGGVVRRSDAHRRLDASGHLAVHAVAVPVRARRMHPPHVVANTVRDRSPGSRYRARACDRDRPAARHRLEDVSAEGGYAQRHARESLSHAADARGDRASADTRRVCPARRVGRNAPRAPRPRARGLFRHHRDLRRCCDIRHKAPMDHPSARGRTLPDSDPAARAATRRRGYPCGAAGHPPTGASPG